MASTSIIGAVMQRYQTFTIASTVPIYFSSAPIKDGSTNVQPPYVVLVDDGMSPEYEFEHNPIETTNFRFEVFALTLAAADAIASAIRYNGGAINAGAGMDFAASLDLTGLTLKAVVRRSEQRTQEGGRGVDAKPVFRISMRYEAEALRTA